MSKAMASGLPLPAEHFANSVRASIRGRVRLLAKFVRSLRLEAGRLFGSSCSSVGSTQSATNRSWALRPHENRRGLELQSEG